MQQTNAEANQSETLISLLDKSFREFADFPAVSHDNVTLTYAMLEKRVNEIARALVRKGLTEEQVVTIDMPRGVDYVISLLAVIKAGGCYLALDYNQPRHARDELLAQFPGCVSLNQKTNFPPSSMDTDLPELPSHAAACVVFTSGTTSSKKAILLEHRNIAWFARNSTIPHLSPGKSMIQMSSPDFDTFIFELWRSLACGSELKIMPPLPELVSRGLTRELKRHKIRGMLAPATVLNRLSHTEPEAFAQLDLLCSGGDVLRLETARLVNESGFKGVFMNLYGPTETTVACTGHRITGDEVHSIPIGKALDGAELTVVGEDGNPVNAGEVGTLVVSGNGVARGYVNGQSSSFTEESGKRSYNTGDKVKLGDNGELYFRGRETGWIKIEGVRVDLSEIEATLLAAGAQEAAVIAVGDEGVQRLAGFIVADSHHKVRDYRTKLMEELPKQAVPSDLRILEKMPVDPNGKRDVSLLQREYRSLVRNRRTLSKARNQIDSHLITIWEDLLGVENVGIDDDFFALGGHSLLAVKHRSFVQRHWGCDIPAETMFEVTVLREFSDFLHETLNEKEVIK